MTESCLQLLLMIGAPMATWSVLMHREVVVVLLGQQYAQASYVFPLIVLGALLWQFGQIYQKGFETAARTKPIGGSILYALGLSIFWNLLLVPKFGIAGAAVATVGAYGCYGTAIFVRVAAFGRPEIPTRSFFNVTVATVMSSLMFMIFKSFDPSLWLKAVACILCFSVYAGTLLLCKEAILAAQLRQIQRAFGAK